MRPRRPYKRLVGDTPRLRARFHDEHPDVPISTERGSAYRKWLNAQRRAARPLAPSTPRPKVSYRLSVHRNTLLHEAFLAAIRRGEVEGTPWGKTSSYDYSGWLRSKGIDFDTGRMTLDGLAFYKELRDEKNRRRAARRNAPS